MVGSGNAYGDGAVTTGQANSNSSCKKNYYINIPEVTPSNIPVIFKNPFAPFEDKIIPSFLIRRLDATPAMNRWHSVGATQYRTPSDNAIFESATLLNGTVVSGWSEYEQLPQAMPFDINYSITAYARYERDAIPMLRKLLSVYKPYSRILVKDSLNTIRTYTVFNDSGFSDDSELVDVTDRTRAYTVSIKIEGELDLSDPEVNTTVLEIEQNTERL
jgi:hypothetical protein